jgi:TRAP-type uncharacterized transport system fused permease subunit
VVRCIAAIVGVCWFWALIHVVIHLFGGTGPKSARELWEVFCKNNAMGLKKIWDSLLQGSVQAVIVAVAIITSGIMVGIFDLTGVAVKFSSLIVDIAGDNLFFALILIMLTAIVLGMGLPLSSAYIIQVGIAIPALVTMMKGLGLPVSILVPQAHLFVIFFSAFSAITPPTAPTSYAAAAIARSPIMPTAIEAMKLALPAFLLPFMFVLDPSLLLIGSGMTVTIGVIFALGGVIAVSIAVQNYAYGPLNPMTRLLFLAAGIGMIGPNLYWHVPGAVVAVGLLLYQRARFGREKLAKASFEA